MPTIFISHKSENDEFVSWLAEQLKAAGFSPWVDHLDIGPGQNWDATVGAALDSAQAMILVLTPLSVESDNVTDEWSYFLDEKKALVPILLEKCKLPFRLRRVQRVDFTDPGAREAAMQRLSKALAGYGLKPQPPPRRSKVSPRVQAILDLDDPPESIRAWWDEYRARHPRITTKPADVNVQLYLAGIEAGLDEREHYQLRRYLFVRYCDDQDRVFHAREEEHVRDYFYDLCRTWRSRYREDRGEDDDVTMTQFDA